MDGSDVWLFTIVTCGNSAYPGFHFALFLVVRVGKSFSTRADGAESPPALWEASGLKHGWVVVANSRIEDALKRCAPYLLGHHGYGDDAGLTCRYLCRS